MSNGKKELKEIKQEHNGPVVNYNDKFAKLSKFLPVEDEYTTVGLPETLVSETGERVSTEQLDEGQLSKIKRGSIPTVPYVTQAADPTLSIFPVKEKKFYIK